MSSITPTNPLAAHIGNGTVILNWTETNPNLVSHYEIWASEDNINYFRYMNVTFEGIDRAQVYNFPIGITAYIRIRAIDLSGNPDVFVNFKAGKVQKPTHIFLVQAIDGSLIKKGAVFAILDASDRIIGIQATADIPISC